MSVPLLFSFPMLLGSPPVATAPPSLALPSLCSSPVATAPVSPPLPSPCSSPTVIASVWTSGGKEREISWIWECIELLNEFIDDSDPDLDMPQIKHLLQIAKAIRKDYPDEDWLHLAGLIHDLDQVLLHPSFGELPQWVVISDTFPVGYAFNKCNVHFKYLKENPDYHNPEFNTKLP